MIMHVFPHGHGHNNRTCMVYALICFDINSIICYYVLLSKANKQQSPFIIHVLSRIFLPLEKKKLYKLMICLFKKSWIVRFCDLVSINNDV